MGYEANSYGKVGILAYKKIKDLKGKSLKEEDVVKIWKECCREENLSQSSIDKCCPRGAFIGILKELSLDIQWEDKENKNVNYSKVGIKILKENKNKNYTRQELWKEILKELNIDKKSLNGQTDIILSFWNIGVFK